MVVLVVAIWSDFVESGAQTEGEALRAGGERRTAGLLLQVLAGLRGIAPLLLNKLFERLDSKGRAAASAAADGRDTSRSAVVRVHQDPPALKRLRTRQQVVGAFRARTPTRGAPPALPAVRPGTLARAVSRFRSDPGAATGAEIVAAVGEADAISPENFGAVFDPGRRP